jgi:hypothetical protein
MRVETKRRIWTVYRVPWRWWPDVYFQAGCSWSACWGCLAVEWTSKEWLSDCERHGHGLGRMIDWITEETDLGG